MTTGYLGFDFRLFLHDIFGYFLSVSPAVIAFFVLLVGIAVEHILERCGLILKGNHYKYTKAVALNHQVTGIRIEYNARNTLFGVIFVTRYMYMVDGRRYDYLMHCSNIPSETVTLYWDDDPCRAFTMADMDADVKVLLIRILPFIVCFFVYLFIRWYW